MADASSIWTSAAIVIEGSIGFVTAHDWRGTNTVAVTVAVTRLLSLKVSNAVEYPSHARRRLRAAGYEDDRGAGLLLRATASPVTVPAPIQASV